MVFATYFKCLTVLIALQQITAFKTFQDRIPNGGSVPHPCKPNYLWYGVGHKNREGGGTINPFGTDFKENGYMWDECLCGKDSDGDGRSNGQELGDPECVWTPEKIPATTKNITHPGICDPYDSSECSKMNDWEICSATEFECRALNDPGVMSIVLRFPPTAVPAQETTYMCMTFDLPQNGSYHLIADEPMIDNHYVVHHIIIYGCDDGSDVSIDTPSQCDMGNEQCLNLLAIWTVGHLGTCHDKSFGFPIGGSGYKRVLMQVHWNNPDFRTDFVDSSGLSLFYTAEKRDNDAGMSIIGQSVISIPPQQQLYTVTGDCPQRCTAELPHDIHIASALLHMHYLGVSGSIEVKRDGVLRHSLVNEPDYSYDRPIFHQYSEPKMLQPGDNIDIVCNYKSTSKDSTTYYGDGTSDEMCFGFLIYYPVVPVIKECTAYGKGHTCGGDEPNWEDIFGDCNTTTFFADDAFVLTFNLLDNCQASCTTKCNTILAEAHQHVCLSGTATVYIEYYMEYVVDNHYATIIYDNTGENVTGSYVISLLHACDQNTFKRPSNTGLDIYKPSGKCGTSHGTTTVASFSLVTSVAAGVLLLVLISTYII